MQLEKHLANAGGIMTCGLNNTYILSEHNHKTPGEVEVGNYNYIHIDMKCQTLEALLP